MSKTFEGKKLNKLEWSQIQMFQYAWVDWQEAWVQWNVKEIKSTVDNKNIFGALSMDLSKTFGCLSYELVIAKLNVYGFSLPAWRLVYDYLSNRQ